MTSEQREKPSLSPAMTLFFVVDNYVSLYRVKFSGIHGKEKRRQKEKADRVKQSR